MLERYYSIGKKYGMTLKNRIIENIQTRLEKQVSAYIHHHSRKYAPLEAMILALKCEDQKNELSAQEIRDEYDRIVYNRAAAKRNRSARMRKKAFDDILQKHKKNMAYLEAFVKKSERKGDWNYQRFLMGAAKNGSVINQSTPIHFKSQVYHDFQEKCQREIGVHEN